MRNYVATFLLLLATAHHAAAQDYKFQPLNYNQADGTFLEASNVFGRIVGVYFTDPNNEALWQCFTYWDGTKTEINDPKAVGDTGCFGINNVGTIVGQYTASTTTVVGFVYRRGSFMDVAPVGSTYTVVGGISDRGVMVGSAYIAGVWHGFAYDGRSYQMIDIPGATATFAQSVNDQGQVSVFAVLSDQHYHSFLLERRQPPREISFPNSTDNFASQINNHGQIAVSWSDAQGLSHGGVYDSANSTYYVIDVPNAAGGTSINGINDNESLVGSFQATSTGINQGFVATGRVRW